MSNEDCEEVTDSIEIPFAKSTSENGDTTAENMSVDTSENDNVPIERDQTPVLSDAPEDEESSNFSEGVEDEEEDGIEELRTTSPALDGLVANGHVLNGNIEVNGNGQLKTGKKRSAVRHEVEKWKYDVVYEQEGGIKFACSRCGSRYRWRKSLSKHWREKHDGQGPPTKKQHHNNTGPPASIFEGPVKASPVAISKAQTLPTSSAPSLPTAFHPAFLPLTHNPLAAAFGLSLFPSAYTLPFVSTGTANGGSLPPKSMPMLKPITDGKDFITTASKAPPKVAASPERRSFAAGGALDLSKPVPASRNSGETPLDLSSGPKAAVEAESFGNKANEFFCPTCNTHYKEWTVYFAHLQEHYQGSKQLTNHLTKSTPSPNANKQSESVQRCENCSFTTRYPSQLQKHMVSHSDERPFSCESCGHGFKWRWDLDKHREHVHNINRKRGKDEPGNEEAEMKKRKTLEQLTMTRTEEALSAVQSAEESDGGRSQGTPPPLLLSQNISGDASSVSSGLDGEKKARSKGRKPNRSRYNEKDVSLPYMCALCDYRARWPSEIHQHMKNHSDEKPYCCHLCSYRSKWKWDVVKHFKRCGPGTIKDVIDTTKERPHPLADKIIYMGKSAECSPRSDIKEEMDIESIPAPIKPKKEVKIEPKRVKKETEAVPSPIPTLSMTTASALSAFAGPSLMAFPGMPQPFFAGYPTMVDPTSAMQQIANMAASAVAAASMANADRSFKDSTASETSSVTGNQCSVCNVTFSTTTELARHIKTHSELKPYCCASCEYRSRWKCDLKKHCRNYGHEMGICPPNKRRGPPRSSEPGSPEPSTPEEQEMSLPSCRLCGIMTNTHSELLEHLSKHSSNDQDKQQLPGSKSYNCKTCTFQSNDIGALVLHQKSVHEAVMPSPPHTPNEKSPTAEMELEKPQEPERRRRKAAAPMHNVRLVCSFCPHVSISRTAEAEHLNHHGSEAEGAFGCSFCDFRTELETQTRAHELLHPEFMQEQMNNGDSAGEEVDSDDSLGFDRDAMAAAMIQQTPPSEVSPVSESSPSALRDADDATEQVHGEEEEVVDDGARCNSPGFSGREMMEAVARARVPLPPLDNNDGDEEVGDFKCSQCDMTFSSRHVLSYHSQQHQTASSLPAPTTVA